jgi:peptidoglycan/xylan/chitin deacetylase (PgdA/CDA1 family)
MVLVHNIGTENHSNYHTREQILASTQPLGFDGIYKNVYDNQDVLTGKSGIFFVMGNYIGGDNAFDLAHVPKLEQYCTMAQIEEMCTKYDFEIGWHTWGHPDLTKLTEEEVMREITPPTPMRYFAYPYGNFNQMVIDCVKRAGYQKAWSVTQGSQNQNEPDYDYKIYRPYL